ncbi:MAG: GNAT family N-acetyltransferase [Spirosomataceae bacterium]
MTNSGDYHFRLETERTVFDTCAAMMASSPPWTTLGMNLEQCRMAFEGENKEVYVLTYQEQVAGFAVLQLGGSFKGYIQILFVADAFRGKQLAYRLLQHCEERILRISPNLFICVSSFNTVAQAIYKKYGFEQVGVLHDFLRKGFDELLLRKTIAPILEYKP